LLAYSAHSRQMILSNTESLRRKLDFLLLMHTEGSGKLNISMQLVATSDLRNHAFAIALNLTQRRVLFLCCLQAALVAIKKINRSFTVTKPLLMQFKKVCSPAHACLTGIVFIFCWLICIYNSTNLVHDRKTTVCLKKNRTAIRLI